MKRMEINQQNRKREWKLINKINQINQQNKVRYWSHFQSSVLNGKLNLHRDPNFVLLNTCFLHMGELVSSQNS